jgi:hypothetical protein
MKSGREQQQGLYSRSSSSSQIIFLLSASYPQTSIALPQTRFLSVCLSIYLSIYPSIHLSICGSTALMAFGRFPPPTPFFFLFVSTLLMLASVWRDLRKVLGLLNVFQISLNDITCILIINYIHPHFWSQKTGRIPDCCQTNVYSCAGTILCLS